ncbi:TetR/AcrR family transcriptional regulator [Mycobacteroides abscessus]|uniref:Bacterial regulatory s, tetR family protein n=3 Tax=Mycobacteroides abscessus TaxID=36809 RepID=A0A829Q1T5_9MYCO|nr:bacterial regulatory s, tetR family protein [Mycobacteroides abscessus 21]PVA13129.1 TetR/AcrR family transcriptional regulator [Mycobacteroides abscessus]RIR20352.1 TetR/AcrR family transcriptional regulator [Mycobacteroides abscessus]RIT67278.1 TetR/AcrR family transcriptional regulator [Mycobacteroides abscessus]
MRKGRMTDDTAGRRRGRPSVGVLNRDRIVDAALAELRASGLRKLTMRAVAVRLGVTVAALYNHVPSRAGLLVAVQERFTAGLDVSGFGIVPLREALSRWAWSYLDQLRRRPELLPLIVEVPLAQAPLTSGMYQRVTAGFAAAGWPEESIIASMSILETFIFGAAVDSPGPTDVYAPYDPANAPQMGRVYEAFARSVRERQTRAHDLVFTMGLDAALIGLHHIWGTGRGWAGVRLPAQRQ